MNENEKVKKTVPSKEAMLEKKPEKKQIKKSEVISKKEKKENTKSTNSIQNMFAKIAKKCSESDLKNPSVVDTEPEIIEIDIDSKEDQENLNVKQKSPVKKNKTPKKIKTPTKQTVLTKTKTPTKKKSPAKKKMTVATPKTPAAAPKIPVESPKTSSTVLKTPISTPKIPLVTKTTENGLKEDKTESKSQNSIKKIGKENNTTPAVNKTKTPKTTPTQKKGKFTPDNKQRSLSDFFKATPK